ncbi:MAG: hypothetical protein ACKN9V_01575 [Pseudomonadota bacterium]
MKIGPARPELKPMEMTALKLWHSKDSTSIVEVGNEQWAWMNKFA